MHSSIWSMVLGTCLFIIQSTANEQKPCFDQKCSSRFPEGGYCTLLPTSPFCNPETPRCLSSSVGKSCSCCRNCADNGCSSVGRGWSCVNQTTAAASDKHCTDHYCAQSSSLDASSKCFCCPPDQPCKDRGCREEGGECVKESESEECWKIHDDPELCHRNDETEKCLCCLKPPKPCDETSLECAKRGAGYSCVPREEAADWPVPCEHSCHPQGNRNCMCCPPKPLEVNCKDIGCSKEFPGYECQNASVAANYPKRCLESDKLCSSMIEEYTINITADNAFHLYADGDLIGSENYWLSVYSFSTAASVLAVFALNWGGPAGIILSTSNALVTDTTWRCIDATLVMDRAWAEPGFDDSSWPNGLSMGYNGVSPWGFRPGISSSAQWIWAPGRPTPNKVYCRKNIGAHRCFCCPPVDPPNECIDSGCEEAFGDQSVGECKDVTNPDFEKLSQVFDLNVKPTGENLCKNSVDKSCCRCLKKKPCLDDGCQDAFNGDGICLDVENDDLSMIDFSVEKKLGLCKNNLRKDCCFCYKKRGKTDCHQKSCTYKDMTGECVGPKGSPPPNHIKTPGECPGKDCVCWVPETEGCSRDPVCEESLHGQCLPHGAQLPHHKPSNYKCQDFANRNCTCMTPYCEHPDCQAKGGQCLLPWERVPAGYMPNGLVCNEKLNCKCYTREPCNPTKECERLRGTCRYPDDVRPADEVEGDFCDENLGCKCYYTTTVRCTNPKCTNERGLCVSPGDQVPSPNIYSYKDGDFCDERKNCKCYRPKCPQHKTCTKLKGKCFMKGMPIPAGSKSAMYKGKPFFCNKKLKCKCMLVPIITPVKPVAVGIGLA